MQNVKEQRWHKTKVGLSATVLKELDKDYVEVESFLKQAFKKKKTWYASDIAEALGIDYLKVREVLAQMINEGKLSAR